MRVATSLQWLTCTVGNTCTEPISMADGLPVTVLHITTYLGKAMITYVDYHVLCETALIVDNTRAPRLDRNK